MDVVSSVDPERVRAALLAVAGTDTKAVPHLRASLPCEPKSANRKGLGNYLGLSRLLAFVANEVGLAPGQVTVNAGYARADAEGLGGVTCWREIAAQVGAPCVLVQ